MKVCLPIPINYVAGVVHHLWIICKRGPINLPTNMSLVDTIIRQQEFIEKLYRQNGRLFDMQMQREGRTTAPRPEPQQATPPTDHMGELLQETLQETIALLGQPRRRQ